MNMEGNIAVADSLLMGILVVIIGMAIEPTLILLGGLIIISALIASAVEEKRKSEDRDKILKFDSENTYSEENTA